MADKLDMEQRELLNDDLQKQCQEVLAGLSFDGELATFKQEYQKIYSALKESHENERRLGRKAKELSNEIMNNAAKVQQALRLSEEDSQTIEDLKLQLEKSYRMVEQANRKEEEAHQSIERMQGENSQLASIVQKQNSLLGNDLTIEDVLNQREMLVAKVRDIEETLEYERKRADGVSQDLQARNEKQRELKASLKELERRMNAKDADGIKEAKKKAALEADIQKFKEQMGAALSALELSKRTQSDAVAKRDSLSNQLEAGKAAMTATLAELHALQSARVKLTDELEDKMQVIDGMNSVRMKSEAELRELREKLAEEERVRAKTEHKLAAAVREFEQARKDMDAGKQEQLKLKGSLTTMEKDLNREIHHMKDVERTAQRLEREKGTAEKAAATEKSLTATVKAQADSISRELKASESEVGRVATEASKLRSVASAMERDREKLLNEIGALKEEVEDVQEGMRLRDVSLKEAKKVEAELHAKVKNVQGMYEFMRAERNSASKSLMEALDEIGELKRKGKVQGNQIEQLKEDVHMKDRALVAEQFEASSLGKQLTSRMGEVETLKRLLDEGSENNRRQEVEMNELNGAIKKQDSEAMTQKRAFDAVVGERDVLAMQLQRRNDENALLYERASIQTSTLKAGEKEYGLRLDEMRFLKQKLTEAKRQLTLATAGKGGSEHLKNEMNRLTEDLASEQSKVRALTEELENPLNVHRWRKLEGSDPTQYELVQKVHTLQKRLIVKTEEAVEKDIALNEKEKQLNDALARLANIPGPELADQLTQAQQLVNERTRQLKALASETNMYQAQIAEYRYELERAAKEMVELKRSALATDVSVRIGTGKGKAESQGGAPGTSITASGLGSSGTVRDRPHARVLGGGFNVTVQPPH